MDLAECKTTHRQHESKTRKEAQTVTAQLHMVQREVCSFVSYEEALYAKLHVVLKAGFKRSGIRGPAVKLRADERTTTKANGSSSESVCLYDKQLKTLDNPKFHGPG